MTNLEIVRYALGVLPYLMMVGATFLAVGAKTKLDEIAYLLWAIIFMLVILGDKVGL
jgi:hypothetical protein